MIQVEWGKVVVAVSAIVGAITLILVGETTAGASLLTLIVGYTIGNGRLISRSQEPVHMLMRKPGDPGPGGPG